jgi:hypothetical protein
MTEGKLKHKIIRDYTEYALRHGIDYETMTDLIDKYFRDCGLNESVRMNMRSELLEFAQCGIEPDRVIDYERRHTVDIGGGVNVQVVFDRVDAFKDFNGKVLEIVDYKNHHKVLSEQDVEDHEQLKIYAYVAAKYLYPGFSYLRVGVYHLRYNFIRWGKSKKIGEMVAEFENTENWIFRQWDRLIKTPVEEMVPEKCSACWQYGGCAVMRAGECPAYTKAELKKMIGGKDIADRVRAFRHLSLETKRIKDYLQAYFKTNEHIEVDGSACGYNAKTDYCYDMEGFIAFCIKNGVELEGERISKTVAERLMKKRLDLKNLAKPMLEKLETIKIATARNTLSL